MNGLATWNPARLAEARRGAGLSQEALADRLTTILRRDARPVRTRNVVRWERPRGTKGAHAPHVDFIAAIAEATSQEPDYFLTADDEDDEEPHPLTHHLVIPVNVSIDYALLARAMEQRAQA